MATVSLHIFGTIGVIYFWHYQDTALASFVGRVRCWGTVHEAPHALNVIFTLVQQLG